MKIQSLNSAYGLYCAKNMSNKQAVSNSPFASVNFKGDMGGGYMRIFDPAKEQIERENYRKEFMDKIFVEVADENGNPILDNALRPKTILDPAIKEALDNSVFHFEGPDGEKFSGTIKEALEKYITYVDDDSVIMYQGLLHGCSQESLNDIIENGPDMKKISRSVFGPGMYFALSEGDAQDYSSAKVKADIVKTKRENGEIGKFVRLKGAFYEKVTNMAVTNMACQLAGIDPESIYCYPQGQPYYISQIKQEVAKKLIDEYCRNILVDELGIDAGYGHAPYHHSCIVVFNPDSVQNASNYNEETNTQRNYWGY